MSRQPAIVIRPVDADAVVDLRHRVLREGLPRDTAIFVGDQLPTTIHLAAFDEWDVMLGCVTLMQCPWQMSSSVPQPAWQLRGMAVEHAYRSHGIGTQLLLAVDVEVLVQGHARLLWCNARCPAVAFYERNGWNVASPSFEIPSAGPHQKMTKHL
jgi:GNAT superfamily N-acetyltransferase